MRGSLLLAALCLLALPALAEVSYNGGGANGGSIRPGNDTDACASGNSGAIKYSGGLLAYCNGSTWSTLASSASTAGLAAGVSGSIQFRDGTGAFNGNADLVVDHLTRVGVGMTPSFQMDISGTFRVSGAGSGVWFSDRSNISSASAIYRQGNKTRFYDSLGGDRMVIDNTNGNVGIGVTNPQAGLQIAMDAKASQASQPFGDWSGNGQLWITGKTSPTYRLAIGVDTTQNPPVGIINSIESTCCARPLSLNPTGGDVGIGVTHPNASLDVLGDISASSAVYVGRPAIGFVQLYPGTAGYTGHVDFVNTAGTRVGYMGYASLTTGLFISTDRSTPLVFNTSGTEAMRITASNNVGINTNNPSFALQVSGAVAFGGPSSGVGYTMALQGNTTYSGYNAYYMQNGTRMGYVGFGGTSGNPLLVQTDTSLTEISFRPSATEAMRIDSIGRVGIGTTNPAYRFHVVDATGSSPAIMGVHNGTGVAVYGNSTGGYGVYGISSNNTGIIGTTTSSTRGGVGGYSQDSSKYGILGYQNIYSLYSVGTLYNTGSVTLAGIGGVQGTSSLCITVGNASVSQYSGACGTTSDRRLKKDIAIVAGSLEKLAGLNGVTFHWKDPKAETKLRYGVIAQDVEKVFPSLVTTDPSTTLKVVDYQGLTAPLIEAVKELKKQNDDLRRRVERLEAGSEDQLPVRQSRSAKARSSSPITSP